MSELKTYSVDVYFENDGFFVKAKNVREAKKKAKAKIKRKNPKISDLYIDER